MRELHAWHGDRQHAADANADAPATMHARHAPRHAVLRNPADRVAEHLAYRKTVEAALAGPAEQVKPEARRERAPVELRDRPGKISERWESLEDQDEKKRKPERSRLPSNETAQLVAGVSIAASSVADATSVLPGRWDAVAASALGAMVAGIARGK